ncbi:hypothetical protein V1283_001343 [Bradyrhizobium sp. AZCC 2262]
MTSSGKQAIAPNASVKTGAAADTPIKFGAGPHPPGASPFLTNGSMTRHGEWGLDDTLKLATSCPPELGRFGDRE